MKKNLGRQPEFDIEKYRKNRSSVGRFFAWLKRGFRKLVIRYERLVTTYMGFCI